MCQLAAAAGVTVTVDSAGTGGWHAGELPDPRTRRAAAARGLTLTHRARQLTSDDFAAFDFILVMDDQNMRNVLAWPGADASKVKMLRSFDPTAAIGAEVPDPYTGDAAAFEEVLDICERACAGLLAYISKI